MKFHRFRPKKQKRGLLYQVFVVVAILQIAALLALGGMVVTRTILPPENVMQAPPPAEVIEPPKREHQVQVERTQRKSTRINKRISVANPTQINTPTVNIQLPGGMGAGVGISTITTQNLTKTFDITLTTVNVIGVKSKTEKVLICVDTGPYLMTDERGGLQTYEAIREDITNVVKQLPPTVLFNLMSFSTHTGARISFFEPTLVAATDANKEAAYKWIAPLNVSLKSIGPRGPQYNLKYPFLPIPPSSKYFNAGVSTIYRVYQAALEQGADTIYFLVTNWVDPDQLKMAWTDAETTRFQREQERYEKERARQLRAAGWTDDKQSEYELKEAEARAIGIKKARDWIKRENETRAKKGQSLYVGTPEQAMHQQKFYVPPTERPPAIRVKEPVPKFKSYGYKGLFDFYAKPLAKEVYFDKKMKWPTVNIIMFVGANEKPDPKKVQLIRTFTSRQNGKSRTLVGLGAVGDAAKAIAEENEKPKETPKSSAKDNAAKGKKK